MAALAPHPPQKNGFSDTIVTALKDFGVPTGKALQLGRSWASSADYIKDVQSFTDNYNRYKTIKDAAKSLDITLVNSLADDKLKQLTERVNAISQAAAQSTTHTHLSSVLPSDFSGGSGSGACPANTVDANEVIKQKEHLESQMKEMKAFATKWNDVFSSKEAMQAKADEILQRGAWMKLIELGMVFKDVCLNFNSAVQRNAKIKSHYDELVRIDTDYVRPVMDTFQKSGTVDRAKVDMALMQLRFIRSRCVVEQKETVSSWFGNVSNAFNMGFQAFASFKNASALEGIASQCVLNWTYSVSAVQGALSFGSVVLTCVDSYDYVRYKNIIDKTEEVSDMLTFYAQQIAVQ